MINTPVTDASGSHTPSTDAPGIHLLIGPPNSGKTTYVMEKGAALLSKLDFVRTALRYDQRCLVVDVDRSTVVKESLRALHQQVKAAGAVLYICYSTREIHPMQHYYLQEEPSDTADRSLLGADWRNL